MECFNIGTIYNDFRYPKLFIKALELNLVDFNFWYFMSTEQQRRKIKIKRKKDTQKGN